MKTHILFVVILYKIATTDSKQCYSCQNNCDSAEVTNCSTSSKCFSKTTTTNNTISEIKGCAESTNPCSDSDEISSCYTCDSDLCNARDEIDKGVGRCYVCVEKCKVPADQHDCEEVLTEIEGRVVKAACLKFEMKQEDKVTIHKGCVMDDSDTRGACNLANLVYEEVSCSMCSEDLCNGEKEDEERYVEECYHCVGEKCENLEVQNCKEFLGENAKSKCIAVEHLVNDQLVTSRQCIEVTAEVQVGCDVINQQGGNCTICDTNLCNGIHVEENYVDECYYCDGVCSPPLELHKCKEILGEDANSKCITTVIVEDGKTIEGRGCIDVDETVLDKCEAINQGQGNCTICDTNRCNGISSAKIIYFSFYILLLGVLFTNIGS